MKGTLFLCTSLLSVFVACHGERKDVVLQQTGISNDEFQQFSKKYARAWLDGLIPTAVANVSEKCKSDSVLYRDELSAFTSWALRMFDATGKLPDGIISGNWHALGDYEQCLRIKPENVTFRGKYCQVFLAKVGELPQKSLPMWLFRLLAALTPSPPLDPGNQVIGNPQQPSFGVCLPSSCSANDISVALTSLTTGDVSIFGVGVAATTTEGFCSVTTDEPPAFDEGAIAMLSVLGVIGGFLFTGTVLDIAKHYGILKHTDGLFFRVMNCFSIISNGSKLLSTKSSGDNLACIHGIRFLSFTWVLLGHAYSQTYFPTANYALFLEQVQYSVAFQAIINSYVSVDSFLFMTGLLLAFLYLKAMKKTGTKWGITSQVNPLMLIVHRFLRLTPVYALIIGFYVNLWPLLSDGPGWYVVESAASNCRGQWWANLLYIQNLVFEYPACLEVTWYLAVEFQTFVVATLFVWLIYCYEFVGVAVTAVVALAGAIVGAVFMAVWDMPPTFFNLPGASDQFEGVWHFFFTFYEDAWFRFPPFFVGMLTGWILYKIRQPEYIKPKWLTPVMARILSLIAWVLATTSSVGILYGMFGYSDGSPRIPEDLQAFYGGFHRFIWAICLGWLVFACVNGYGGPINTILTWKPFMVLGRLTFAAYLIHVDWMKLYLSHARSPLYYTNLTMIYTLLGHITVTLVLATIATLAFEIPFLNLEKLIFEPSKDKRDLEPQRGSQAYSEKHESDHELKLPRNPANSEKDQGIPSSGSEVSSDDHELKMQNISENDTGVSNSGFDVSSKDD